MRALRWLVPLALLACAVTVCAVFGRGLIHLLGIDTQQSDNYDFVSGVGPMIIAALGYVGIIGGMWHHINCRAPGCLLLGHYPDSRGVKWCGRHHPDHKGQRPTMELLHRLHFEHKAGSP